MAKGTKEKSIQITSLMKAASENIKIRKATVKDAGSIDKLNTEFFHEEGRSWEELISSGDSEMFVLELNKDKDILCI